MEIGHQGADIAQTVGLAPGVLRALEIGHGLAGGRVPIVPIGLVDRIDLAGLWNTDVGMGKQKLPDAGIHGETVHPGSGGIDHHGRGSVQEIARRHLFAASLQQVAQAFAVAGTLGPVDGEDGAHIDVGVDVGRAVQGVEDEKVFTLGEGVGDEDEIGVLLGGDGAQHPGPLHAMDEHLVGVLVELLHLLALDVDLAGEPQNVHQPGLAHFPGDNLGRQDEFVQKPGETPGGHGRFLLVQQQVLGDGDLGHLASPWRRQAAHRSCGRVRPDGHPYNEGGGVSVSGGNSVPTDASLGGSSVMDASAAWPISAAWAFSSLASLPVGAWVRYRMGMCPM